MKKYLAWIPALVIMTAIFWFSAQPADVSTEMSDSVTRALLWTAEAVGLTDRLSPEQVHDLCGLLATPVRKTAHITEFAVLHLTVLFALFHAVGIAQFQGCYLHDGILIQLIRRHADNGHP